MRDDLILVKCIKVINSCENLKQLINSKNYVNLYYLKHNGKKYHNKIEFVWRHRYSEITKNK